MRAIGVRALLAMISHVGMLGLSLAGVTRCTHNPLHARTGGCFGVLGAQGPTIAPRCGAASVPPLDTLRLRLPRYWLKLVPLTVNPPKTLDGNPYHIHSEARARTQLPPPSPH